MSNKVSLPLSVSMKSNFCDTVFMRKELRNVIRSPDYCIADIFRQIKFRFFCSETDIMKILPANSNDC